MSDLTGSERRKLEKLLGMGGGYVLNFSDRTFGDFFDEYRVEIDSERYKVRGTSKANPDAHLLGCGWKPCRGACDWWTDRVCDR